MTELFWDVSRWTVEQTCQYLEEEGHEVSTIEKFRENGIDGIKLRSLKISDLREMDINSSEERGKILQSIRNVWGITEQGKVFNDPIHGHIELHPLLIKIIDTPQFQRLRYIKQMGGACFVYPGASHNRFSHSIGVAHLAGQLVSTLKSQQPELGIDSRDVLCVQIAGLCHDLGHGPFSHMFDEMFIDKPEDKTKPKSEADEEHKSARKHEYRSCKMFDHLVEDNQLEEVMEENGLKLPQDQNFIKALIDPPKVGSDRFSQLENETGRSEDKSFLYEIVSNKRNGIDVDKWDYFARDCYHLGVANNFNYQRFLKFARVCEVDGKKQICTRDKEAANLYDMFHTRYNIHRTAAHHRVTNIIQLMIADAFRKADRHINVEGSQGQMFHLSTAIYDMEAFTKLTDHVFEEILHSPRRELEEARQILKRIQKRDLYKCLDELKDPSPMEVEDLRDALAHDLPHGLGDRDFEVWPFTIDYGMEDMDPVKYIYFYTKTDPDTASKLSPEKVSKFLPCSFRERVVRVFFRKTDQVSVDAAKAHLRILIPSTR